MSDSFANPELSELFDAMSDEHQAFFITFAETGSIYKAYNAASQDEKGASYSAIVKLAKAMMKEGGLRDTLAKHRELMLSRTLSSDFFKRHALTAVANMALSGIETIVDEEGNTKEVFIGTDKEAVIKSIGMLDKIDTKENEAASNIPDFISSILSAIDGSTKTLDADRDELDDSV
ncbi:MAG: hypothetical protein V4629_03110 [Pseudomonadota bacterium]